MLASHPFDIAILVRTRRKYLKLRQIEVARAAGVSRNFLGDLEHGKPTLEFGKVMEVLRALNIGVSFAWNLDPPKWSLSLTEAAAARQQVFAARRPPGFREKRRPFPEPPPGFRDRPDPIEGEAKPGDWI